MLGGHSVGQHLLNDYNFRIPPGLSKLFSIDRFDLFKKVVLRSETGIKNIFITFLKRKRGVVL